MPALRSQQKRPSLRTGFSLLVLRSLGRRRKGAEGYSAASGADSSLLAEADFAVAIDVENFHSHGVAFFADTFDGANAEISVGNIKQKAVRRTWEKV